MIRATGQLSLFIVVSALICFTSAACSSGSSTPPPAAAASAAPADSGLQTVVGQAPAASGNFPAIVILEPIGGGDAPAQAEPPRMDQEQQTFIPSILLVRTGQPVEFLNHDDVLHNVRVRDDETKESAFNVAIPTGEKFIHTFARDGFYDVGCDIHPGMSAQILSSSSPYSVVADPSGAFTIRNVPNGPYKAIVYAGAQKIEKDVSVAPGAGTIDLTTP
jgi:plastocyanin